MNDATVWKAVGDELELKTGEELRSALKSGASANETFDWGEDELDQEVPLNRALLSWDVDMETVKTLLAHGADVEHSSFNGYAPLNCTRSGDAVELLVAHGADVNAPNGLGQSPLWFAIGDEAPLGVVEALIKHGADVNETSLEYGSILMDAIYLHPDALESLIKAGADVNFKNDIGSTPLHKAARGDKANLVELFLKYGADWRTTNDLDHTAEDCAPVGQACQTLIAVRSKHELLEGLGTAWKPSDCKENTQSSNIEQPERQVRKRLM